MYRRLVGILILLLAFFSGMHLVAAGIFDGFDTSKIQNSSINIGTSTDSNVIEVSRDVGMRVLMAVRLVISGFALIYMVLIGAYMVTYSENEDRVKSQRNQITYALIGFLFLNIPSTLYTLFFERSTPSTITIGSETTFDFLDMAALSGAGGFIPMLIGFFEIFIFGIAIATFTWGFFRLILSGGNEEIQKKAK
jgi:glucose uptake protein GlcU